MSPVVKRLLWIVVGLVLILSFVPSVVASSVGGLLLVVAFLGLIVVVMVRGVSGSRPASGVGARSITDLAAYRWSDLGIGLVLGFAVGETFATSAGVAGVFTAVAAITYRLLRRPGLSGLVLLVVGFIATVTSLIELQGGAPCVPPGDTGPVLAAVLISVMAIIVAALIGRSLLGLGGTVLGLRGFGDVRTAGLAPAILLVVFSLIELAEYAFSPASADLLGANPWVKVMMAVLVLAASVLMSANAELLLGLLGLGLTLTKGWLALVEQSLVSGTGTGTAAELCLGGLVPLMCAAIGAVVIGVRTRQ